MSTGRQRWHSGVQCVIYVSLAWIFLSIVFEEYEKIANKSIEDSIKSETHGSLEEAMLTVGKKGAPLLAHLHPQSGKVIASDWISVFKGHSPPPVPSTLTLQPRSLKSHLKSLSVACLDLFFVVSLQPPTLHEGVLVCECSCTDEC